MERSARKNDLPPGGTGHQAGESASAGTRRDLSPLLPAGSPHSVEGNYRLQEEALTPIYNSAEDKKRKEKSVPKTSGRIKRPIEAVDCKGDCKASPEAKVPTARRGRWKHSANPRRTQVTTVEEEELTEAQSDSDKEETIRLSKRGKEESRSQERGENLLSKIVEAGKKGQKEDPNQSSGEDEMDIEEGKEEEDEKRKEEKDVEDNLQKIDRIGKERDLLCAEMVEVLRDTREVVKNRSDLSADFKEELTVVLQKFEEDAADLSKLLDTSWVREIYVRYRAHKAEKQKLEEEVLKLRVEQEANERVMSRLNGEVTELKAEVGRLKDLIWTIQNRPPLAAGGCAAKVKKRRPATEDAPLVRERS
ncbi:unnamed protein product [Diatraea saccharalis]|uniref:Uncharacterized protein n=1 Tax=Diatraea saccharalis TaxID=40085 RepID=A0A9N9R698_9NEOP|nr:unnamed protein product [Diatraea saccharalis]